MAEYDVLDAFEYNIQKAKDLADVVDVIERGKGTGGWLYQSAEGLVKSLIPSETMESVAPFTGRLESGFNGSLVS